MNLSLIVTDAGPLVTLAVAESLDTLLLPRLPVIIPDMVRFEVTRHADKPGAKALLDWIRRHTGKEVRVDSTETFEEFVLLSRMDPSARIRNRGEQAAAEILSRELAQGHAGALLLFEDSDIRKTSFLIRLPDQVLVLSTSAFLLGLQKAGLIPDAQAILARAVPVRGSAIHKPVATQTGEGPDIRDEWVSYVKPS
ncbi:hypothetical protein [Acidiferrobacter thiooxydans]|jgi:hypothetical protein|uniref:DUF3368 domain-containing protein n=1 Tax=Acidiferrobacter thiooxydans TaxID=163359 RepID=A0A368HE27_9GAMM|nr:hypothetical protein [Acidiferrobacter thiooxydans]RCN55770.1 hypothetical protein C4900_07560 [Acidiferrobacter thiooxydans]